MGNDDAVTNDLRALLNPFILLLTSIIRFSPIENYSFELNCIKIKLYCNYKSNLSRFNL